MGGAIHKNDDGDWVTHTHRRRLHLPQPARLREGRRLCASTRRRVAAASVRSTGSPQVCWQVPLRFDQWTDDNGHTTYLLREWKRHDWGEGGAEFAWWCTDDPLAFSEDRPVWRSLRDEIVELVGQGPYEKLVDYLVHREATHPEAPVFLPHPQVRRRDENPDD